MITYGHVSEPRFISKEKDAVPCAIIGESCCDIPAYSLEALNIISTALVSGYYLFFVQFLEIFFVTSSEPVWINPIIEAQSYE